MNVFEKLMQLDRRWVFLFLIIVCLISHFMDFDVPIKPEPEVTSIYEFVDSLPPGEIVMVAMDYDPGSLAEMHPMTYALVEHCWRKNLKVLITALSQNGPGMADQAIRDISDSVRLERTYNGVTYPGREVVNGVDYTFLGYKPYPTIVILAMGQNYRLPFPTDYYGTPIDSLPMMQGVQNYDDVAVVINISATNATDYWISYGQGRYGFPLAIGVTGVSTAQYYPFLGSGQIFGIMGGLLGAAQLEQLCDNPGWAKAGMRIQLWAHIVIILFIVMGNVGFFVTRRRQTKAEGR
jgi:hypothetical protein